MWGDLVTLACRVRKLTEAERRAYNAPFPSEEYKAASRVFPHLVPIFSGHPSVEENKGAWRRVLQRWDKPLLTMFSDKDDVSRGGEVGFQTRVPGAAGQAHVAIRGAGHFVQEDRPAEVVATLDAFIKASPNVRRGRQAEYQARL